MREPLRLRPRLRLPHPRRLRLRDKRVTLARLFRDDIRELSLAKLEEFALRRVVSRAEVGDGALEAFLSRAHRLVRDLHLRDALVHLRRALSRRGVHHGFDGFFHRLQFPRGFRVGAGRRRLPDRRQLGFSGVEVVAKRAGAGDVLGGFGGSNEGVGRVGEFVQIVERGEERRLGEGDAVVESLDLRAHRLEQRLVLGVSGALAFARLGRLREIPPGGLAVPLLLGDLRRGVAPLVAQRGESERGPRLRRRLRPRHGVSREGVLAELLPDLLGHAPHRALQLVVQLIQGAVDEVTRGADEGVHLAEVVRG